MLLQRVCQMFCGIEYLLCNEKSNARSLWFLYNKHTAVIPIYPPERIALIHLDNLLNFLIAETLIHFEAK